MVENLLHHFLQRPPKPPQLPRHGHIQRPNGRARRPSKGEQQHLLGVAGFGKRQRNRRPAVADVRPAAHHLRAVQVAERHVVETIREGIGRNLAQGAHMNVALGIAGRAPGRKQVAGGHHRHVQGAVVAQVVGQGVVVRRDAVAQALVAVGGAFAGHQLPHLRIAQKRHGRHHQPRHGRPVGQHNALLQVLGRHAAHHMHPQGLQQRSRGIQGRGRVVVAAHDHHIVADGRVFQPCQKGVIQLPGCRRRVAGVEYVAGHH